MNKNLVKYGISAVTALVVGACAFVTYGKILGVNKDTEEDVPVEDISEEEIEPDDFDEE